MSNESKNEIGCGLVIAVLSFIVAVIALIPAFGAWFYPQQAQEVENPVVPSSPGLNTSIPPPLSPPESQKTSMISGKWVGTYTCSLGITGVTIDIDQIHNRVIADFSLYPVQENPNIPRGLAKYEGDFNSISRRMSFSEGIWINQPEDWIAYPFYGRFDESLNTFSGEIDGHRCTTINLVKQASQEN